MMLTPSARRTADAVGKIRWSFAVELRGGIFGFLLPPAQIRPSGEEMSAAFVALADYVVRVSLAFLAFFFSPA